jgi:alpha-tubulin suppressor-like RCC1 family protein
LLLVAASLFVLIGSAGAGATMQLRATRDIATGAYHACAVTSAGGLLCWGKNEEGQVGDGSTVERHAPTPIPGLEGGVVAVSANYSDSCALTDSGVMCWGRNDHGQLGDGTTHDRYSPVGVQGLPVGVSAISVGKNHACAIGSGKLYCWGRNDQGQLGTIGTAETLRPGVVAGLPAVRAVATGKNFTCALTVAGAVTCWGRNGNGQLGNGSLAASAVPVQPARLASDVLAIAATGDFACALLKGSVVKCWGENDHGQLGNGSTSDALVPTAVRNPGTSLVAITAGANHACTLGKTGEARCWGRNDHGQLGDGTTRESHVPVPVRNLGIGAVEISAGASGHFVCALTGGGMVKCWGRNTYGQLGNGSTADSPTPATIMRLV